MKERLTDFSFTYLKDFKVFLSDRNIKNDISCIFLNYNPGISTMVTLCDNIVQSDAYTLFNNIYSPFNLYFFKKHEFPKYIPEITNNDIITNTLFHNDVYMLCKALFNAKHTITIYSFYQYLTLLCNKSLHVTLHSPSEKTENIIGYNFEGVLNCDHALLFVIILIIAGKTAKPEYLTLS
ncbi:hypothetical protein WA158_006698, partial [Blastocystis sp. Blastoise]